MTDTARFYQHQAHRGIAPPGGETPHRRIAEGADPADESWTPATAPKTRVDLAAGGRASRSVVARDEEADRQDGDRHEEHAQ
ncbi:hypothetical protein [Streptomyces sp. KL116D]|uniref:hypothetical protein n=1 Tax=Streptomyces sp. KL116D TaxID=3045152 RepID=UPI003558C4D4